MALTTDQYVDKVFYRLSKGLPEQAAGIFRSAIEASIPQALQDLAEAISQSPSTKRALLQKLFSFTLSSGEVALSGQPTMLIGTIPQTGYVLLSGTTQPLQWLPYRIDLQNPPYLVDYGYYTLFENKIVVRTNLGAVPSATALTVYCSFVPTLTEVGTELEDDLVLIGCGLFSTQQPPDVNDNA